MPELWLIIADDLTGACDTGAGFARAGFETTVLLESHGSPMPGEIVVVNINSRYQTEERARQAILDTFTMPYAGSHDLQIYHKIDSTLRGHPAGELNTILQVTGRDRTLVSPAFPAQGRTVRAGRVQVQGEPLENSLFGKEVVTGDLARLFNSGMHIPLDLVHSGRENLARVIRAGRGIFIADAETQEDLTNLAQSGMDAGIRLWCGSAGLARALAELTKTGRNPIFSDPFHRSPWLVVAGSLHPATQLQVDKIEQVGAKIFSIFGESRPDQSILKSGEDALSTRLLETLEEGRTAVVYTRGSGAAHHGGKEIAAGLGRVVASVAKKRAGRSLTLFLTGGETASAVCDALECTQIKLQAEIQPGVALGCMLNGLCSGWTVITKAGGFGGPDLLVDLLYP